jgi:hypothetical protein
MRRLLALAALAAAVLISSCSGSDVAEKAGVAPLDVREIRAQKTVDDFFGALDDENWSAACSHLTPEGFAQIMRVAGAPNGIPFSRCAQALKLAFQGGEDLGSARVTKAEPSPGQGIHVETEGGDQFTMDAQYRIAHFAPTGE